MTPRWIVPLMIATCATAWYAPARADEAKTPVSAALILNIMTNPVEPRERAFDRSLREDGPAPLTPGADVLRHVTITVRNPCPPDSVHYEAPPLPGRRARN